jgi:hypothetical protein
MIHKCIDIEMEPLMAQIESIIIYNSVTEYDESAIF